MLAQPEAYTNEHRNSAISPLAQINGQGSPYEDERSVAIAAVLAAAIEGGSRTRIDGCVALPLLANERKR